MSHRPFASATSLFIALALVAGAVVFSGCGGNDDPGGATELWNRIQADKYRTWKRAPGWEVRRDSNAPHSNATEIFVNPTVSDALAAGKPLSAWPTGSLIVKDGYDGNTHEIVAAMEKRADGWYWAEWEANGQVDFSGKPDLCLDCHRAGSDFVRAFSLPK